MLKIFVVMNNNAWFISQLLNAQHKFKTGFPISIWLTENNISNVSNLVMSRRTFVYGEEILSQCQPIHIMAMYSNTSQCFHLLRHAISLLFIKQTSPLSVLHLTW